MRSVTDRLFRTSLERHPAHQGPSVDAIRAEVSGDHEALHVAFEFTGGLRYLALPETPLDPAKLWEHTCAELFVGLDDGTYVEWNFSPTRQVARFEFSEYRVRRSACFDEAVEISVVRGDRAVRILARGPLLRGITPVVSLGLSVVARAPGGDCSYWALRHASAEPDFHDARGFALDGRRFFA